MLFGINILLGHKVNYGRFLLVLLSILVAMNSVSCGNTQKSRFQVEPPAAQRTLAGLPPQSWTSDTVASLQQPGSYSSIASGPDGILHIAYYDSTSADLKHAYFQNSTWTTEAVDTTGDVGKYCSIDVNAQNTIYIAYFDETTWSLKVATHTNGGSWQTAIVDGPHVQGRYPRFEMSCALSCDTSGRPHIAYADPDRIHYSILYASWNGLTWDIETAQLDSWTPVISCLLLTSNNIPYIGYTESLFYLGAICKKNGLWQGVGTPLGQGSSVSLYENSTNQIAIVYVHRNFLPPVGGSELWIATETQQGWTYSTLDASQGADIISSCSVSRDSSEGAVISYSKAVSGVHALRSTESGWIGSQIDDHQISPQTLNITLDNSDIPHVCYMISSGNTLTRATTIGSSWHHTEIRSYGPGQYRADFTYTSLDISKSFKKAFSYHDEYGYNAGVATKAPGSGWSAATLDPWFSSGEYGTSARYNSDGLLGVAYYCFDDYDGSTLRFAEEQPDGSFIISQVAESPVWGGLFPSLAYAPDGQPAIAWCGMSGGNVIYSRRYNGAWNHELAYDHDFYGDMMAIGPSLAFNSEGEPTIGFVSISPSPIEWPWVCFTERVSSPYHWELSQDLDEGDFTMQSVSMVYDAENEPAIAYVDRSNNELRLLRRVGGIWNITSPLTNYIDLRNSVSGDGGASLKFDSEGNPNIALAFDSQQMHSIAMTFLDSDTQIWMLITANMQAFSPEGISLAFDPFGYPSIAFSACYSDNPLEQRALRVVEWH